MQHYFKGLYNIALNLKLHRNYTMKVTIQSITVTKYYVFSDVAIFQLQVNFVEEEGYVLFSRFSNFEKFYKQFISELTKQDVSLLNYIPPKPPKRFHNKTDTVLNERKVLITDFFKKILRFKLNEKINSLKLYLDPISGLNAKTTYLMLQFLEMQKLNKLIEHKLERGFSIREGNITNILVSGYIVKSGNIYYRLIVTNHHLPMPYNTWEVDARYSKLLDFHNNIKKYLYFNYSNLLLIIPTFPRRELSLGSASKKTVIKRRVCLLNNYLKVLLLIKEIRESKIFEEFLGL